MKSVKALLFACIFAMPLFANTGNPVSENPALDNFLPLLNIDFNKIFFQGEDDYTLFIDFEAVANPLTFISIIHEGNTLMTDEVSDLPLNAIYEINLEIIRSGNYTIEIETLDGIKILKDIWVE